MPPKYETLIVCILICFEYISWSEIWTNTFDILTLGVNQSLVLQRSSASRTTAMFGSLYSITLTPKCRAGNVWNKHLPLHNLSLACTLDSQGRSSVAVATVVANLIESLFSRFIPQNNVPAIPHLARIVEL
jgi:hypothetical protein